MNDIGSFLSTDFTYENLEGECSFCSQRFIVNRATDLGNALPAGRRIFACPSCSRMLRIGGDTANHPIDLLLFEVYPLKLRRQYMQCVLALAQALEITLTVCVAQVLVRAPLEREPEGAEELLAVFEKRLKNMTLEPLRNLAMKLAIHDIRPQSVIEAKRWLAEVNNLARDSPSKELISEIADAQLREAVALLRTITVGSLRNDVAHYLGARPTQAETEAHEAQVKAVIKQLLKSFGVTPGGGQLIIAPAG